MSSLSISSVAKTYASYNLLITCLASPTLAPKFFQILLPIRTIVRACALKSNQALASDFVLFVCFVYDRGGINVLTGSNPGNWTILFYLTKVPCKNPEKEIDLANIFGFQMIDWYLK